MAKRDDYVKNKRIGALISIVVPEPYTTQSCPAYFGLGQQLNCMAIATQALCF